MGKKDKKYLEETVSLGHKTFSCSNPKNTIFLSLYICKILLFNTGGGQVTAIEPRVRKTKV